jgi:alpha-tubulin suppressor-like RCC1 family protein
MDWLGLNRRAGPTAWLVIAVLSAASCRDDRVAGPSDQATDESGPSLATTTTALAFSQVSAGGAHTCGLTSGGQVYCWGWNYSGQIGDGTVETRTHPTLVLGGLLFRQVSAGEEHTCALTTGYRAYCWGRNGLGAAGDGTTIERRLTPVAVASSLAFRQISAGGRSTCALTNSTNKIYCWGSGILGNGSSSTLHTTPQLVSGARTYREVSVGGSHTCAVSTMQKVLCWGYNNYGQLGNGAASSFTAVNPVAVAGTLQYLQVSAGSYHTCAVTITDKAFCWGNGRQGQIGDGKMYLRFTPRAVLGGLSFDRVSAGHAHTCGETTGNRAYCWGWNESGELGDGTYNQRLTPKAVAGGLVFKQVDTGGAHTCGVDNGSRAWSWGDNSVGQLGNGTSSTFPLEGVASPTPVHQ